MKVLVKISKVTKFHHVDGKLRLRKENLKGNFIYEKDEEGKSYENSGKIQSEDQWYQVEFTIGKRKIVLPYWDSLENVVVDLENNLKKMNLEMYV